MRQGISLTLVGLATSLTSFGCSTLCEEDPQCASNISATGNPPLPQGFEGDGFVVDCPLASVSETTGAPESMVTCISKDSIGTEYGPGCHRNFGIRDLYRRAICAKTFGGVPSDYMQRPPGDGLTDLDDYPTSEFEGVGLCDTTQSFDEFDEIPEATDAILLATGVYDRCSRESYCETLLEIIDEFPNDGIELDPWCNVSPSGDSQSPAPWICVGSSVYGSNGACGYAYLEKNLPDETIICPIVEPGGKNYCVIAEGEGAASDKCEAVCGMAHTAYLDNYGSIVYPAAGELDCGVFDTNTMLWASDPVSQCHNDMNEIEVANAEPFKFGANLLIDGGAHASFSDDETVGFIVYRVENCVGLACDIVIESVEVSYLWYEGTYYDSGNDPFPYSVDGVWIALLEPVSGTITPSLTSPPVVDFQEQVFDMRLYTGDLTLDSTPLGAIGPLSIPVWEVAGFYDSGILTLDIVYETEDATMGLTLTTF